MIPRNFFPNMPDEIFEMWLLPIAEDYGWPFKDASDCVEGTKWSGVFRNYDLKFWTTIEWALIEAKIHSELFTNGTCFRLNSIIKRCVERLPTLLANVESSEERFRTCADYIRINGNIPKPIVAIIISKKVEIVDGYHRVAALLHVGIPPGYKVPMWVPRYKQEDTPA